MPQTIKPSRSATERQGLLLVSTVSVLLQGSASAPQTDQHGRAFPRLNQSSDRRMVVPSRARAGRGRGPRRRSGSRRAPGAALHRLDITPLGGTIQSVGGRRVLGSVDPLGRSSETGVCSISRGTNVPSALPALSPRDKHGVARRRGQAYPRRPEN